jgi:hypothetical protein
MVYPITGPFTRTETSKGPALAGGFKPDHLWYQRTWYRQRRPYGTPMDLTYQRSQVLVTTGDGASSDYETYNTDGTSFWGIYNSAAGALFNKAHARFIQDVKPDTVSLLLAYAERKQSMAMIAHRMQTMLSFSMNLASGKYRKAAKSLHMERMPKGWRNPTKGFGDKFLEAHFGWEPIIRDIWSCVDLLQNGVPPARAVGFARMSDSSTYMTPVNSSPLWTYDYSSEYMYKIGAKVKVVNPNLWLANQLGLVNPAGVAFDAIPFSFVLDWFVNVQQFLEQFTSLWGLELSDQFVTWQRTVKTLKRKYSSGYNSGIYSYVNKRPWITSRFSRHECIRKAGSIPGPSLRVRDPWRISPVRGLTATSLLTQFLRKQ